MPVFAKPLALLIGLFAMAPAMAATAPRLAETGFAQLAQPLPLPYDEKADAHADIRAATARAIAHHRLLLIDLGGNWCPDCRVLAGTIALPDLQPFVERHYEVVAVNVGRYTKNMDIPALYGAPRVQGVPMILIVEPRSQRLVNAGHTTALSDARSLSPQALADWLAQWTNSER